MGAISLPTVFYSIAATHQLHRLKTDSRVRIFLKGMGPAAAGMTLAVGFTIARAALVDAGVGLLAIARLVALVHYKVDSTLVVVGAGVIGGFLFS